MPKNIQANLICMALRLSGKIKQHVSHMFHISFPVFLLTIVTIFNSPVTYATPPDINGTYTGKISGDEDCPPLGNFPSTEDDTFTGDLTFTVTQNGNNFSGSGTGVDEDGEGLSFQFSGTVDDSGNISANIDIQSDVAQSGFFSGTFSNGTLDLFFDFSDNGPPNCHFFANGTFSRTNTSGITVNPEITPSSILTAPLLLNTQVKSISGDLNNRIGDVLRGIGIGPKQTATGFMWQGHSSGLNAGDTTAVGYGAWGSYSYSDFDNDFISTAFDGHRHNFLAGLDIAPFERTILGVAIGYELSDIDTGFNRGNQETDGFTIAPYFGYLLTDNLSMDASLGYSSVSYDQFRTDPGTNARITSDPDADRWFGAFNLNGFTTWDNWLLLARVGILHARNITERFVESDGTLVAESKTKLGQFNIGGEAAYSYGEYEPFVRFSYEHDYSLTEITIIGGGAQPSNDNDNFLVGAGLRFFKSNGLTGNLEWNKRLGREDYDEDSITATVRWDF